jgi:hypothetical protein
MSKKKERNLKNHIEALLGPEIELETKLVVPIATQTLQRGKLTSRRVNVVIAENLDTVGSPSDICAFFNILDVSGTGVTGQDGTAELKLSNFLCRDDFPDAFTSPAIVVATSRAQSPILVTARASVTSNERDVKIEVETWDTSGSPAPRQSFNWSCRVPIAPAAD